MMEQVLITGAGGFVGQSLCQHLKSAGSAPVIIYGMNRSQRQGPWDHAVAYDLAAGDVVSCDCLADTDTIFHLASKAHAVSERPGSEDGYREVIVSGTQKLLHAAETAGCQRFIYVSSVKAMGEGNGVGELAPIDENSSSAPLTPYGRAKLEAERLVLDSSIPHVAVLRPVMVYGPNQRGNLVRMVNAVRRGRFPPLPETGNRRSMVHVEDLVRAIVAAATVIEANRETIIISEDQPFSTRQLFEEIRKALGMQPCRWSIPSEALQILARGGDLMSTVLGRRFPFDSSTLDKLLGSAWYDNTRAKELLHWHPRHQVSAFLHELGKTDASI